MRPRSMPHADLRSPCPQPRPESPVVPVMNLKTTITAAGAAAALALPGVAVAADAPKVPSSQEQCRTQRTAMGATVFKQTYGTNADRSNGFGKCVSQRNK